jgi:hypothetical protein
MVCSHAMIVIVRRGAAGLPESGPLGLRLPVPRPVGAAGGHAGPGSWTRDSGLSLRLGYRIFSSLRQMGSRSEFASVASARMLGLRAVIMTHFRVTVLTCRHDRSP